MLLYYFTSSEHGLDNVKRNRIRISRVNDLNDPFELLANIQTDKKLRSAFNNLKNKFHDDNGLICFSEKWQNPVMWSHYADKHRGVCLGFEIDDSIGMKVVYRKRRLKHDMRAFGANNPEREKIMMECLKTKFSHWSYEQEQRVFIELGHSTKDDAGNYFQDFDKSLQLRSILIGANSILSRADIECAVTIGKHGRDLQIYKTRAAFQTFNIVRSRNEALWV